MEKKRQFLWISVVVALVLLLIILLLYQRSVLGYTVWADWTGFGEYSGSFPKDQRGKTLWDWLDLLIVPVLLAIVAYLFDRSQKNRETKRSEDNRQEEVLQDYFDYISEAITDKNIFNSKPGDHIRSLIRSRTLITLRQLNPKRKSLLMKFLIESKLVSKTNESGEIIINLSTADLEEVNLSGETPIAVEKIGTEQFGVDKREIKIGVPNLKGAILESANLGRSNLNHANLESADLTLAKLEGARLIGTNMRGASLRWASLVGAYMSGDLNNADLEYANLKGADLRYTDLSDANLRNANIKGADLDKAILLRARYNKLTKWPDGYDYKNSGAIGPAAILENKDLQGVDLSGVDFTGADLTDAKLTGARYNLITTWPDGFDYKNSGAIGPEANLDKINLSRANLLGACLHGTILSNANLAGADLSKADLRSANLKGANLREAELGKAIYDEFTEWPDGFDYKNSGAIGPGANLKWVDLKGTNLELVNLKDADLAYADLAGADLHITTLTGANLEGANLYLATVEDSKLMRAKSLEGATMPDGKKYKPREGVRKTA